MTERKVSGVPDDPKELSKINVKVSDSESNEKPKKTDVFQKNFNDLGLSGIKPNLKRKATRDLAKTHTGQEGTGTKQVEAESTGYNYLNVVQPPFNLDWLAELTTINPQHYAAIRAKEANIVSLGYKLVESPKTKRKLNELDDEKGLTKLRKKLAQSKDELLDYLDQLNDDDSLLEVLGRMWFDYESTGVGYLEFGRKSNGQIGYIGHIPSTTIRVRRKRDGYVQIVSNKAVFFRNFGDTTTENPVGTDTNPNEIMMFKKYSATDSFYGMPDIMSATQAVAGNEFAARYNLDYFENKAVPRHVIVLKGAEFSVAAEKSILEFFETGLKGQNHRSLFVPLPGDRQDEKVSLEIKPVESGVQDQSFEKYKKNNQSEILLAHRVPPNKIGLTEGMSVATALDASKTFRDQVCLPQQRMLAKKLNRVIKELTDVFLLEFNELTLTDEDTQSKIDERYVKNQVDTPNEIRARRGLPGIKGGDKVVEVKPATPSTGQNSPSKTSARSAATTTTSADGRAPKGTGRASGSI